MSYGTPQRIEDDRGPMLPRRAATTWARPKKSTGEWRGQGGRRPKKLTNKTRGRGAWSRACYRDRLRYRFGKARR